MMWAFAINVYANPVGTLTLEVVQHGFNVTPGLNGLHLDVLQTLLMFSWLQRVKVDPIHKFNNNSHVWYYAGRNDSLSSEGQNYIIRAG